MEYNQLDIRLPLQLQADITTECWNYYRMAVVNTYSNSEFLLLNHFNQIYMDEYKEIHYGFSLHKPNVYQTYSSVLNTYDVPLSIIKTMDEFIELTIACLKKGTYPLIECDYNFITEQEANYISIHEIMIYGIVNGNFIVPLLRKGRWSEVLIPVKTIAQAFWNRKNLSLEEEKKHIWRREYVAPYTVLCPKKENHHFNCLYDFYYDICRILERSCIENNLFQTKRFYKKEYPGVLAVYNGVLEILNDVLQEKFNIFEEHYSLEINLKRIYEYNCLFCKHIEAFQTNCEVQISSNVFEEWEAIKELTKYAYLLAIKYRKLNKNAIIYSISDAICSAFKLQHSALTKIQHSLEDHMISNKLYFFC